MLTTPRKVDTYEEELKRAFPAIDPEHAVLGHRVLVQIRMPRSESKGGIKYTQETKDTERDTTQTARVVQVGPVAFRNRTTLEPWPEGEWIVAGDFVRVPIYGGDRWEVPVTGREDKVTFVVFKDSDMIAKITGNPLEVKAYV